MAADNDTLKTSIAELIGKKPSDLKPENGVNVIRNWMAYLADQGYTVTHYLHSQRVSERHVILHSVSDGTVQGVLSDSDTAATVEPIGRLTVTKTRKADSHKDA